MSGLLDSPSDWPSWAKDSLAERIAIMEADDIGDAEAKAIARVRLEAERVSA